MKKILKDDQILVLRCKWNINAMIGAKGIPIRKASHNTQQDQTIVILRTTIHNRQPIHHATKTSRNHIFYVKMVRQRTRRPLYSA